LQNLPCETEGNHQERQSERRISGHRIKPETSRIRSRAGNLSSRSQLSVKSDSYFTTHHVHIFHRTEFYVELRVQVMQKGERDEAI